MHESLFLGYLNRKMGFEVGMRVRVINQRTYKSFDLIDSTGSIRDINGSRIRVTLDGIRNPNSSYGSFYFTPGELEIIDMKEKVMQNITNYLNIAKVQFIDNNTTNPKTYDYANFDPHLCVGDICMVKTANHGFGLAKVMEIVDQNDIATPREVVASIDTSAYDERVAKRDKAAELKVKMQERVKQLQDIALYKMMAENDSTMSELLNEYQAVSEM